MLQQTDPAAYPFACFVGSCLAETPSYMDSEMRLQPAVKEALTGGDSAYIIKPL